MPHSNSWRHLLEKDKSFDNFILNLQAIRALSEGGPGYGNQAATWNVLQWLRARNFTGVAEIIYPQFDSARVSKIYGIDENIDSVFEDTKRGLRFIELTYFAEHFSSFPEQTLGFTGGYFGPVCQAAYRENPSEELNRSLRCRDLAIFTNTNAFLRYGPYYFGERLKYVFSDTIISIQHLATNTLRSYHIPDSEKKFVISPPPKSLTEISDFILHHSVGQKILVEKPGLLPLIESIKDLS